MKFRTSLIAWFLLLTISCQSGDRIEAGVVNGRSYENRDAGVAVEFPESWNIIHDHETFKLISKEIMSEVEYRRQWESALAKPLVACYKYKDHKNLQASINPNFMISVEYIPPRSDVKNAFDYLEQYRKALEKHSTEYTFEQPRTIESGEFKFASIRMTFVLNNVT